jgi:maleylacetate reductase
VAEAAEVVTAARGDGVVALGGGSAIDTAKAVVAELARRGSTPLPRIVAVPTTYAGAEWTSFFGLLEAPGRKGGGADERATPLAAIYDPELTLDLPRVDTVGTAMNALAHCAEALYHPRRTEAAVDNARAGAAAIGRALPLVVDDLQGLGPRTLLLDGAMHAGLALAESGICLGHAMAQVLGGRFGLAQGAMNALCLPAALRFNTVAVPDAVASLAKALSVSDAPVRLEELARLGGFDRLRVFGIPEAELDAVADAIAARPGARANPREVTGADVADLLRAIW